MLEGGRRFLREGREKGRRSENEKVSLLVGIGSPELPLSIGKFQLLGLSIVGSHGCRAAPLMHRRGHEDGDEEDREGKLQRRLGRLLKEFGSVTKFVSLARLAPTFVPLAR